jgi:hypothetical protein
VVRVLLHNRFAPITSHIGFAQAPIDDVVGMRAELLAKNYDTVTTEAFSGTLDEAILALQPLDYGGARDLSIALPNGWVAHLDSNVQGSDATGFAGHANRVLRCASAYVKAVTNTHRPVGVVGFGCYSKPAPGAPRGAARLLQVTQEGRWKWDESGSPLAFETPAIYGARRIRDRLTVELVESYCRALGIDPFNELAYSGPVVLTQASGLRGGDVPGHSLAGVQAARGLSPWNDPIWRAR